MSRYDVNLVAGYGIVQQRVRILRVEAQRFCTDKTNTRISLSVQHVSIVLHQVQLLLRRVETTRVVHPPIGFVLDGHSINVDTVLLHIRQERVQPREELVIAILAQPTFLVALTVGFTTLRRSVGLVLTRRRPRSTENDTTTLFHNLSRWQRTFPVVWSIIIAPLRNNHIAHKVWRDFHTHDVQSNLRRRTVEQSHRLSVIAIRAHGSVAACSTKPRDGLLACCIHSHTDGCSMNRSCGNQHKNRRQKSFH